jgi:hypothetical protein
MTQQNLSLQHKIGWIPAQKIRPFFNMRLQVLRFLCSTCGEEIGAYVWVARSNPARGGSFLETTASFYVYQPFNHRLKSGSPKKCRNVTTLIKF